MAFDGAFLHRTINELKAACECHIDKIYQPSREELVLLLRKKGFVKRLLITVKSGGARIHFTENKYENPAIPPNFCMFLRKHLSSAKLLDITQPELERVAELHFSATNEMGDTVNLRLVCELIGNQANVILVKEDGKILDALRHSDIETSKRLILPGALYEYPPAQQKLNPMIPGLKFLERLNFSEDIDISRELLNCFDGFSPLVCREIEFLIQNLINSGAEHKKALDQAFFGVINSLKKETSAFLISKPDGSPMDFSYIPITQYGSDYKCTEFSSCSEALDAFYTAKDITARIQTAARDIIKLVNNLHARTEKKLALRLKELKNCENRETLRIYGELLKANLHCIQNGASFAEVANYYDENMSTIRIPLNPALSPSKNAEKYFKDYKKTYSAEQTLTALTVKDKEELIYFETVLDSISRCKTIAEISEIREELAQAGYTKRIVAPKKNKNTQVSFKEYTSLEGYKILVGKNNLQNDYITTKLTSKSDMWFHVKNIPGSHVVIFSGGNPISDETLLQAATLAAINSKAASSSQVPVDYTYIKNVKKPSGAKPGMVIYTTNKTLFVNPIENNITLSEKE